MSEAGGFCRWCLSFQITLGLMALFFWLSYRPIKPRYYLISFQLPPNQTAAAAAAVNYTLEIENKNKHMGIYHDALNFSLYYGSNNSGVSVIPSFYQGHGKTADKDGSFDGWAVPWREVNRSMAENGTAAFRVGLETAFRYKVLFWRSRHHWLMMGGEVVVDKEGKKTAEKGIRLGSRAPPLKLNCCAPTLALSLFSLFLLL